MKVNRTDGGEHWVKVTFESAEAAEAAIYASPQSVLGHLVYAEPYHGIPPSRDEAVPERSSFGNESDDGLRTTPSRRRASRPSSMTTAAFTRAMVVPGDFDYSPPRSQTSSRTADTATIGSLADTATVSSGTVTGNSGAVTTGAQLSPTEPPTNNEFCRAIPSVRKAKLLPVEDALLPAPSYTQRIMNHVPFVKWFSGTMIGNEVPRNDLGEFDWDRASLYWKFMYFLDRWFGLFGSEIINADKDD